MQFAGLDKVSEIEDLWKPFEKSIVEVAAEACGVRFHTASLA